MKLTDLTIDTTKARGVWWSYDTRTPCPGNQPVSGAFCVLIKPIDDAFRAAMRDALAPYQIEARRGKALSPDVTRAQAVVWADHVVLSWSGLDDVPHSRERAIEFMIEDRFRLIREFFQQAANAEWGYLVEAEEDAKGN